MTKLIHRLGMSMWLLTVSDIPILIWVDRRVIERQVLTRGIVPTRTATAGRGGGAIGQETGSLNLGSDATSTLSSTSQATPATSESSTPESKGSRKLTTAEVIAIAVGVPSALAAIAGAIFKWRQWRLQKRQAKVSQLQPHDISQDYEEVPPPGYTETATTTSPSHRGDSTGDCIVRKS